MPDDFTELTLPQAVRRLFELNHYRVEGPIKIHGAEIDLIATSKSDPFSTPIYIEATIEYVSNEKYGKDLTKFSLLRAKDPGARCLIVSSKGFTAPVAERARETRIDTLTYGELFNRFERFEAYASLVLGGDTELGRELSKLSTVYEEPDLHDVHGTHPATQFLTHWRDNTDLAKRWLIVVGEYGTGKTALTKILLRRWFQDYHRNPELPIPFRLELRHYTRQFDARGLLHDFLDRNNLGDLSLDFVYSLIRNGRVILLLDGYDEMAQYLHARERRACLEALAELSNEGARGILTSRPNYFSEAEEFQLFEILYRSLEVDKTPLSDATREALQRERTIDSLLESHFLERYERAIRDLNQSQTESLVRRNLVADQDGQAAVLRILSRIFRSIDEGSSIALSGKPVIISYLLEVVESLKAHETAEDITPLTEFQVYTFIVDKLMDRDYRRSPSLLPNRRRAFLQALALKLSKKDNPEMAESDFIGLIEHEFKDELRKLPPETRGRQVEQLFADLRSSATLTRLVSGSVEGWRFSHNSLREFFVAEWLVTKLTAGELENAELHISDPMRIFISSLENEKIEELGGRLAAVWPRPEARYAGGVLLTLLWDGLLRLYSADEDPVKAALRSVAGSSIALDDVFLERLRFSYEDEHQADLASARFANAVLISISFRNANLSDAAFTNALLDGVDFSAAILRNVDFSGSSLSEINVAGADVEGASFVGVGAAISIFVEENAGQLVRLDGIDALGYLNFHGATTDKLPALAIWRNHTKFPILDKVCRKLAEQGARQRRGITQRGIATQDPEFAEDLVRHLEGIGAVENRSGRRGLIAATDTGRTLLGQLVEKNELPAELEEFLRRR